MAADGRDGIFATTAAFSAQLVAALKTIAATSTEDSIGTDIDSLRPFSVNEQSYLYTKALLSQLSLQTNCAGLATGRLVDRISTELDDLLGLTSYVKACWLYWLTGPTDDISYNLFFCDV